MDIENLKYMLSIDKDKTFTGPLANGNLRTKALEPARKELAEKTDIEFQYSFEKEGRKFVRINFDIFTKKLKNHLETASEKETKQMVLEELDNAAPEQQMVFLHTALSQYDFTEEGRAKIMSTPPFAIKFLEVHLQLTLGLSKPKGSLTAYVAGILRGMGWS